MKLISKMLIENWHYFDHEIIEFGTINFLTGENSSGKSTLIDAMQVVLMGETRGDSFNKAANTKSSRSLKSYLLGELGDDLNGKDKFLRGGQQFTTQIVCEFKESENFRNRFCLGALFDVSQSGDVRNIFFVLKDKFEEKDYVYNNVPRNIEELKKYFALKYGEMWKDKVTFYDTNKSYKERILQMYNVHNEKMFGLLKKSISFKNVSNIETFVSENICDEKNKIDVREMQINFREYKEQERKAYEEEKSCKALERINDNFEKFEDMKKSIAVSEYAELFITKTKKENELKEKNQKLKDTENAIIHINNEIGAIENNIKDEENKIDKLNHKLQSCKEKRLQDELLEKISECKKTIEEKNTESDAALNYLTQDARNFYKSNGNVKKVIDENIEILSEYDDSIRNYSDKLLKSLKVYKKIGNIDRDSIKNYSIEYFEDIVRKEEPINIFSDKLYNDILNKEKDYSKEIEILDSRLERLKKGIKDYDEVLIKLKSKIEMDINKKYNSDIKVEILADLIDIKPEFSDWHNTVEAYLNTQRFFLIVEPEYYNDAYYAYKNFRKNNPGIYRYKIVDCKKVYARNIIPKENSLAKTIITDNKYAEAYVNYVLGNVIMCKDDKDLRNYSTAVTIDGMLYKGYTSGTMNSKLWEIHYIGKSSIQQQIAFNEDKLHILTAKNEVLNSIADNMSNMKSNRFMNKQCIEGVITKIYSNIDVAEKETKKLEIYLKELKSIDLTTIQNIQKDLGICKDNKEELDSEKTKLNKKIGSAETEIEITRSEINDISDDINQLRYKLCDYKDEIAEKGKLISDEVIEKNKDINNAIMYCKKSSKSFREKSEKLHNEILKLKYEYCNEFTPLTILDNDNTAFIKEYERKININLPAYKEKIKEAKEESYRQFQSSFLDKLRENIINAQFQIKEINRALKSFEFGNDKYKFDAFPKSEYIKYFEMIMEERTGGDLFEMMFLNKYEDVLNDLFEKIIGTDANSYNDKKLEENIKKFTDYKTYLDFKMYVTDNNGRTENLADTIKSKSGGETQTPFYVSFLASFAQMYKSNLYGLSYKTNTARFIIFDEAFNNMDTVRIEESINLLKELNLQAIICAPTNKASEIMLKVDKTLMVYRKDDNVKVIPWTRGSENIEIY